MPDGVICRPNSKTQKSINFLVQPGRHVPNHGQLQPPDERCGDVTVDSQKTAKNRPGNGLELNLGPFAHGFVVLGYYKGSPPNIDSLYRFSVPCLQEGDSSQNPTEVVKSS